MQVPLLDLRLQYASIRVEILSAVTRVCDSPQLIMGPEVERLESEVAALIGVPHAIAVSSGTDALILALMAGARRDRGPHAVDVEQLTGGQQQYVVASIAERVA